VVFDFDNTIVCGDIGEATLAVLVRDGWLAPGRLSATLSPRFRPPSGRLVAADEDPDLTAYYRAFLAPTAHGTHDPTPLANGYAWAVEVMEGLRVSEVVGATATAFGCSSPGQIRPIEVTPGRPSFPAPFFYPEMVELIAALVGHAYDVWIVSASNVWSVRWMVLQVLNPLLRARGVAQGLTPDHIIGVSTLLTDARHSLFKDAVLVRDDPRYARLDRRVLTQLRLTSRLQFPVPTYAGKVGAVWDALGRRPFLGVGDSPGDHAMLTFSEHRLWIARVEKSGYQRQTARLMRRTNPERWLIQPTRCQFAPGFLGDLRAVKSEFPRIAG
jgi:hypothetical protein